MVTMAAKWAGRCKVCGRVILPGSPREWTKDGGATHVTGEDCAPVVRNVRSLHE